MLGCPAETVLSGETRHGHGRTATEERDVKKFLMIGALALGLAAVSGQEASAWIKCNFSVGLNWSWESGNNSFLWGLWTSGQAPGYPTDAFNGTYAAPSPYAGMMGGGPVHYGDH